MNYGFVIDNRKCIGCHACTVACKAEHDIPLGVNRTWVKYIEKGTFPDTRRFFSVLRCNHCADAPCVTICPVTALFTREDGIVDFDPDRCIGCKACIQGCPYDAIYIDPDSLTAAKCNFCAHRVEVGLEPPCAVVCPEHAIIAGDMDDPETEIARLVKREEVTVRKPEKGTSPKVFYIEADQASLVPGAAPERGEYVWSQGREPGVAPRAPSGGVEGRGVLTDEIWDRVRAVMGEKADAARRVYDAGQTHQGSWGWKVAAYLWTKSIAAGILLVIPFLEGWSSAAHDRDLRLTGIAVAMAFLVATGLLLIADLKRPERFLWVLIRPQWRSWLTRGAWILMLFGLAAAGLAAADLAGQDAARRILAPVAALLGAGTAAYTAFLFWQAKGRDLWQSPLLPVHLLVQAAIAGCAVMLVIGVAAPPISGQALTGLAVWLQRALAAHALIVLIELYAVHQTRDATAAARWARTGARFHMLWWIVLGLGAALPAGLLAIPDTGALIAASLLACAGLWVWEHLYVKAGQVVALS